MSKDTYQGLVNRMKGKDTTESWDVVVSYDENKINELLQIHPISLIQNIKSARGTAEKDSDTSDDDEPTTVNYDFDLKLGNSKLKFKSLETASLTSTLSGTYKKEGDTKTRNIPDGYRLKLTVDLANMSGSHNNNNTNTQFVPDSSSSQYGTVGPSYTVNIGDGSNAARGICLVFKEASPDITFAGSGRKLSRIHAAALTDAIENIMKKQTGHKHFIAGVNSYTSVADMIVLKPRTFAFSIVPGDEQNSLPGTLMMWIGVEGGKGNGRRPNKQDLLSFRPDKAANPIPTGSSASIIFSHDLMANSFFKPSLEKAFKNLKSTTEAGKDFQGMQFSGDLDSADVDIPKKKAEGTAIDHGALSFSPSKPATTITCHPELATSEKPHVTIAYKSDEYSIYWERSKRETTRGDIIPGNLVEDGWVKPTFYWNAHGKWGSKSTGQHNNILTLTFTLDSLWNITYRSEGSDSWFLGSTTRIPGYFRNRSVPAPSISLEMKALDYFLTTNILFPGKHLFKADPPIANNDKSKGLAVPKDLILTGEIQTV